MLEIKEIQTEYGVKYAVVQNGVPSEQGALASFYSRESALRDIERRELIERLCATPPAKPQAAGDIVRTLFASMAR